MALVIPELKLLKIVEAFIHLVRTDYSSKANEEDSLLYKMFGGESIDNYDYFEQAKAVISNTANQPRRLQVFKFFNQKRAHFPTVHIVVSNDTPSGMDNGIGFDFNGEEHSRVFDTKITILVTSDNQEEVAIIYYMLRFLFISGVDTFEYHGIRNIKFSGGDVQLGQEITPPVFSKSIALDFIYDAVTTVLHSGGIIDSIVFGSTMVFVPGEEGDDDEEDSWYLNLVHNLFTGRDVGGCHPAKAISNDSNVEGGTVRDALNWLNNSLTGIDDTVTEEGQNAVRSSGIWAWVMGVMDNLQQWIGNNFLSAVSTSDEFAGDGTQSDPLTINEVAQGKVIPSSLSFSYDVTGNLESIEFDSGRIVTYSRDEWGVVTSYEDANYLWIIGRDIDGNITTITKTEK